MILFVSIFFAFSNSASAATSYSQQIVLSSGWNIISTPRLLESHSFSAPETLNNFSIFILDASRPSGWATMADFGQTEFTPLYGYFINNKSTTTQTLTLNYRASTTPNERLFERKYTKEGWYSFGIANPSYAKEQGENIADINNPDIILNSLLGIVSNYDAVVDFTPIAFATNPDSVALDDSWAFAARSADATNLSEINSLYDFRETKGYAVHIKDNSTLTGFQNNNIPQCSDGIDNDGDGKIDYPADRGCFGVSDNDESGPIITVGSLSITKTSDSLSGNIPASASGVSLAKFTLQAQGENLKIENLNVGFSSSNANVTKLRNGALYANGVQVGSTQDIATLGTQFTLGSALIVQPGHDVSLEIRADVYDSDGINNISYGDTITANLLTSISSNVYRMTSLDYISSSAHAGNMLTVAPSNLQLAKYSAYANQTVVVPQTAYKFGEFRLTTGSTEGVNLSNIAVDFTGTTAAPASITSVYVVYGPVGGTMKTTQIKSTVAVLATPQAFSAGDFIPLNANYVFAVYATLDANATGVVVTRLEVTGTGQNSGGSSDTSAVAGTGLAGQTITVGVGSIIAANDASMPVAAIVVGNTMPKIGSFKFTATNDSFIIDELALQIVNASGAAAIANYEFKDGSTILKDQPMSGVYATATGLSIAVPANGYKVIDVYANLGGVGTGFASTSLNLATVLNSFEYISSTGNKVRTYGATGFGATTTNAFYVYKTKPTITNVALPTTALNNGTQSIYQFMVTADAGGTVAWRTVRFNVTLTTATIASTTYALYDAANQSVVLANTLCIVGSNVICTSTTDQEVSGSKTYVLKATVAGAVVGTSVSVNIPNGAITTFAAATDSATVQLTGASFVWSDESSQPHSSVTQDWNSDFLVRNLPTDSLTMTK